MKPNTIVWFDRLFWAGAVLAVASLAVNFDIVTAAAGSEPGAQMGAAVGGIIGFGVVLGLYILAWYFVSKKASNVARWIYTIIVTLIFLVTLVGAAGLAAGLVTPLQVLIDVARFGLWLAGAVLLFLPASNGWFMRGGKPDKDVFE